MTKRDDYTASGKVLEQQNAARDEGASLVRRQMEQHQAFVKARMDLLGKWCTHGLRPEALLRFLMLDLQQSEQLRKCETGSIFLGLLACAQAGLEPGALKQEAFLVPFFDGKAKMYRATFIAGWRGLVKQARRSREIRGLTANVVNERDHIELDLGSAPKISHRPQLVGDRGPVIGAYAIAYFQNFVDPEWMGREDLDRIEAQATRGGRQTPAWRDWRDQMQRKSPIRRLAKRLPMGIDYMVSAAIEQAHDDDKPEIATQILDSVTDGDASRAEADASTGRQMAQDVVIDRMTEEDKIEALKREIRDNEEAGSHG